MTVAPGRTRHRTEHQYRESPARPDRGDRCADLTAALDRLSGARVLVVGDVMLDRFVHGVVERISPEAPAPILRVDREWARPGGAGNLARNLAALGARCRLLSVVGADDAARQVRDLLDDDPHSDCRLIAAAGRRTSVKERHVAQGRLLLRADRETAEAVSPGLAQSLMDAARAGIRDADAVPGSSESQKLSHTRRSSAMCSSTSVQMISSNSMSSDGRSYRFMTSNRTRSSGTCNRWWNRRRFRTISPVLMLTARMRLPRR